jgi:glycosyltransferase involved in cell wall biosynthesis
MEIHQIVVSASPGDAVTNAAFGLQQLLQRVGPSGLFARYIDPRLDGQVFPLSVYEACAHPDDLLIYHVSIGEPEVVQFLLGRRERLVLVYHNITPAKYFATLDPAFAGLLACGRSELELLRDRADLALAVSAYNAAELESLGYEDVRVSPLPVDASALNGIEPDEATMAELAQLDGPIILYVGQLLPHKRPDLLLQAYHVLTTYLLPEAHLVLLGPGRNERYRRALMTMVAEMNLHRARIPGWVTVEQLAAHYRQAEVFATTSEHEGVCVPLLEAMSFDLPVLARAFGAIPETMGDAGLLLPAEADPFFIAEALAEILTSEALRSELSRRGRDRLTHFALEGAQATFLHHLLQFVDCGAVA